MMQFLIAAQMRHLVGATRQLGEASSTRFDSVLGMGAGNGVMHVACRASSTNYVECFDISQPGSPSRTGSVTPNNQPDHSDQSGNIAVVVSNTETETINVSTRVSADTLAEGGAAVVAVGNYAYTRDGTTIKVIDISTPTSISKVGSVTNANIIGSAGLIDYADGYVFTANDDGLSIIDVSVPATPSFVARHTFSTALTDAGSVVASGDYVYCSGNGKTYAIDVSTASSPSEAGSIAYGAGDGNARKHSAVIGNTLFLREGTNLREIDVSDPTAMSLLGTTGSQNLDGGLQAYGQFLLGVDETNEKIRVLL